VTEEPVVAEPGVDPRPPSPPVGRLTALGGLGSCTHKWVALDKQMLGSQVANQVVGIRYVFYCERCLEIEAKQMNLT